MMFVPLFKHNNYLFKSNLIIPVFLKASFFSSIASYCVLVNLILGVQSPAPSKFASIQYFKVRTHGSCTILKVKRAAWTPTVHCQSCNEKTNTQEYAINFHPYTYFAPLVTSAFKLKEVYISDFSCPETTALTVIMLIFFILQSLYDVLVPCLSQNIVWSTNNSVTLFNQLIDDF